MKHDYRPWNQREKQLQLLWANLGAWIRANHSQIKNAYLTVQDGALAFVLVRKEARYNAAFEDALSDLDCDVANDPALSGVNMHTLALPPTSEEALRSFLDPRYLLTLPVSA